MTKRVKEKTKENQTKSKCRQRNERDEEDAATTEAATTSSKMAG